MKASIQLKYMTSSYNWVLVFKVKGYAITFSGEGHCTFADVRFNVLLICSQGNA